MDLDKEVQGTRALENAKPFPVKGTDYGYDKNMTNPSAGSSKGRSASQADSESKGTDC